MSAFSIGGFLNRVILAGCAVAMITATPNVLAQTSNDASYSSSAQYQLAADEDMGGGSGDPSPQSGNGGYGRGRGGYHPNAYQDRWSHLAFEAGGGFNAPVGNDNPYITWGGNFTLGAGWQFNPQFGVLAEYQFMQNKLPGKFLSSVYDASNLASQGVNQLGGHARIWSLTLNPIFYLRPHGNNNAYVTGGGGFYRKVTTFTTPVDSYCYSYYYGYYTCTQNVTVGHFSSNQGGLNLGVGFTQMMGQNSRVKLFEEARYVWIKTPGPKDQASWGLGTTGLIPVTIGVRW